MGADWLPVLKSDNIVAMLQTRSESVMSNLKGTRPTARRGEAEEQKEQE